MIRRLLLKLRRRRRLHEDLEAELAFHREMAAANDRPAALGNTTRAVEASLDLWRFTALENLWRDVVYACRGLVRTPSLVASAMLSLGLGIGVNTAMFSLGVEFLLSQPSVHDPASVVEVRLGGNSVAPQKVFDVLEQSGFFQDVAGENEETFMNWSDGRETHRVFSVVTSANYFTALGVPMVLGRGILPSDPSDVVVLRHGFWLAHYNGDPTIVGRAILLEGRPHTVVGILPATHRTLIGFGFSPDVYVPISDDQTMLAVYARLKPGTTIADAQAATKVAAERLDGAFPQAFKYAKNVSVMPLAGFARLSSEPMMMTIGAFFLVLLAVVGLVLLIACVNVTGLLLARASARRREFAIRLSLGASRGRLLQQLLVESLLLALTGAAFGLVLAQVTAMLLASIRLPLPLPIQLRIDPDWRVAGYAAVLTMVAAVASGLLPAWQTVKESIAPDLARARRLHLRRVLVVAQVAISVVVLATAFLFLRNLMASSAISPGFDVMHTLRAEINLPAVYKTPEQIAGYANRALPVLQALPGIDSAAAARIVPFTDATRFGSDITFADGHTVNASFSWNAVTADYFRVMAIPVRQGRAFEAADGRGEKVTVVNREFVRRYLGNRSPVGLTFLWGGDSKVLYRIVGVVEGTKTMTVGEDDQPQLYEPLAQITNDRRRMQFVLRSATPALQLGAVRQALRRVDPDAAAEVSTLYSSIGLAFLPSQVGAVLLGSIGVLGLTLAAVGLYGMMAYSVARRIQEIGVRLALGATERDIARMVLTESVRLVGLGSLIGLAAAVLVMRPLAMFLVAGLSPADPASLVAVVVVLSIAGALASWGPVRRASSVDPIAALRYE